MLVKAGLFISLFALCSANALCAAPQPLKQTCPASIPKGCAVADPSKRGQIITIHPQTPSEMKPIQEMLDSSFGATDATVQIQIGEVQQNEKCDKYFKPGDTFSIFEHAALGSYTLNLTKQGTTTPIKYDLTAVGIPGTQTAFPALPAGTAMPNKWFGLKGVIDPTTTLYVFLQANEPVAAGMEKKYIVEVYTKDCKYDPTLSEGARKPLEATTGSGWEPKP